MSELSPEARNGMLKLARKMREIIEGSEEEACQHAELCATILKLSQGSNDFNKEDLIVLETLFSMKELLEIAIALEG